VDRNWRQGAENLTAPDCVRRLWRLKGMADRIEKQTLEPTRRP